MSIIFRRRRLECVLVRGGWGTFGIGSSHHRYSRSLQKEEQRVERPREWTSESLDFSGSWDLFVRAERRGRYMYMEHQSMSPKALHHHKYSQIPVICRDKAKHQRVVCIDLLW